jgi:hypothetical protein
MREEGRGGAGPQLAWWREEVRQWALKGGDEREEKKKNEREDEVVMSE